MKSVLRTLLWLAIIIAGTFAYITIAFHRGETLNSGYILLAAICTYLIGYRFYSKWIDAKALVSNDLRATPCEVHEDGRDFVKTSPWIAFGHHFAAISGPGPLVGPVLAAQFGYLPGTLWILIGVVLGGAVQDFVILAASLRRDGRSLAQMLKDEISPTAGVIGSFAILAIMVILLSVLGLVVVTALAESPWGVFTVAATIPIAVFMGGYLRWIRPGKVLECSVIGVVFLMLSVWGGQYVHSSPTLSSTFHINAYPLGWAVIIYGLAASILPVWLLLAPRDYLSTFMKLGTIGLLAIGVFILLPEIKMPAITRFHDGSGPVVPGKLFPFCLITIACGAISGFHTLICSGISPKIITRERYLRPIGYGAMCLESLVAILALIAACTLDPGVYLAMNIKVAGISPAEIAAATTAKVNAFGTPFFITTDQMQSLANNVQEHTLFGRTGGAATLAVGMSQLFASAFGQKFVALWYHFVLMFEALFILTTLDAGTRVGRYLLQGALGQIFKPLANPSSLSANLICSTLVVSAWGYFLLNGISDPEGGTKALWPIFGIANQLLATIALCLASLILLKKQLLTPNGRPAIALVTVIPLLCLLTITTSSAIQKIAHPDPRIGFLAAAQKDRNDLPALLDTRAKASAPESQTRADLAIRANQRHHTNQQIDTIVTATFLTLVAAIVIISLREAVLLLSKKHTPALTETDPIWLTPDAAQKTGTPILTTVALGCALLQELSGDAAIEREIRLAQATQTTASEDSANCDCTTSSSSDRATRRNAFLLTTERRFSGVTKCC